MAWLQVASEPWTWQLDLLDERWHMGWDGVGLALLPAEGDRPLWAVPVSEGWRSTLRASEALAALRATLISRLEEANPLEVEIEVSSASDQIFDLYNGLMDWVEVLAWAPRSESSSLIGSTALRRAEERQHRASLWLSYCGEV